MRLTLIPTLVVVLAAPAAASAALPPADPSRSSDLWATVNVCDHGVKNANAIGIRASMPGLGELRPSVMYARFQVQYLAKADGKWHNILEKADSGYIRLGPSRSRVMEAGRTFTFLPPPDGGAHTLRGSVTFTWKIKNRVVEKLRRFTEEGHAETADSDPPGFTAATCQIS
jgi:hypothetical protein